MTHKQIFIKQEGTDYTVSLIKNDGATAYFTTELAIMNFKDKLDKPVKENELLKPLIKGN